MTAAENCLLNLLLSAFLL